MKDYEIELTPETAAKKFFLRELLSFFIEKRKKVFADEPITFAVTDFADFIEQKKIKSVMSNTLNFSFIKAHLEACKKISKRDKDLELIDPKQPLLRFTTNKASFVVTCEIESLKRTNAWFTAWLKDGTQWEEKKTSVFKETGKHKITFLGKSTKDSLGLKERGIFSGLANKFNKPCSYGELFDSVVKLYEYDQEKKTNLLSKVYTAKQKRQYIDDGIQAMRKKLYELSGKPDTILAVPGRKSEYILTY